MKRLTSGQIGNSTPKKFKSNSNESSEHEVRNIHPSCMGLKNDEENYFEDDSDPDLLDFDEYLIDEIDDAVLLDIEKNYNVG